MGTWQIHKIADKSVGERVVRFDPLTGEKKLVNPATPGEENEPWPLVGVEFVGDPPETCRVPMKRVMAAIAEGWVRAKDLKPVVRPAGKTQTEYVGVQGSPHVFFHAEGFTVDTVHGDVHYRVTHQPDKYVADGDDETSVTPDVYVEGNTRVDWFYDLERVDG